MDPLVGLVGALVPAAAGFGRGRASGRGGGRGAGRAEGIREGKAAGLQEGTTAGIEEGRRLGREEGHTEGRVSGLSEGRGEYEAALRRVIDSVRRGRTPGDLEPGSAEAELHRALAEGWAPREVEREAAMREAVTRVSAYLHRAVREPLAGAPPDADRDELAERIGRALGALQDLDFFIEEIEEHREGQDLVKLAQTVSREFAADQEVGVRLLLASPSVHADVNGPALLDALYLVLHNAARFGGGATVDLSVAEENGRARLTVRDRGAGFSEEAFARAFDPFYSTSSEGLGLGLPHARKAIERMGGQIELRNVPDGGAEVEISFPSA